MEKGVKADLPFLKETLVFYPFFFFCNLRLTQKHSDLVLFDPLQTSLSFHRFFTNTHRRTWGISGLLDRSGAGSVSQILPFALTRLWGLFRRDEHPCQPLFLFILWQAGGELAGHGAACLSHSVATPGTSPGGGRAARPLSGCCRCRPAGRSAGRTRPAPPASPPHTGRKERAASLRRPD